MNDNEVILKVENLCQYFKMGNYVNRAVNNVSFDIKKGEVFGLVGESGCGKTTTGRSIIKLYDATSGNVWLKGTRIVAGLRSHKVEIEALQKKLKTAATEQEKAEIQTQISRKKADIAAAKDDQKNCDKKYAAQNIAKVKEKYAPLLTEIDPEKLQEIKRKYNSEMRIAKNERLVTGIQMIFQDPVGSLNPRMTVRDLIAEGLIVKGIRDKALIDEKVFAVLETVGLVREHANRYPHEFSGGQRQRIGIARAIIMNPELLIADEPVSALDVSIQAQVITLLNELREKIGLTVLFIAHNISVVKYFCDRIAVMYYGNVMELASTAELFARPMHPYTRALLSAVPYPDPNYEKQRKRIIYNPVLAHDYRESKPSLVEVTPGHFVMANEAEIEKYKQEYNL